MLSLTNQQLNQSQLTQQNKKSDAAMYFVFLEFISKSDNLNENYQQAKESLCENFGVSDTKNMIVPS